MPTTPPSEEHSVPLDRTECEGQPTGPTLDAGQQRRAQEVERWLRQHGGDSEAMPPLDPPPTSSRLPDLPGYEDLEEVGRGGMGVVYKARHRQLDRVVALKMIRCGAIAGPDDLVRFRTEAQALARLQHPNIVQIHEVGEHDGLPFFALEFVDGRTLAGHLDGRGMPPLEAACLVALLARAMQEAHQAGVIHRDLKPGNILLQKPTTPPRPTLALEAGSGSFPRVVLPFGIPKIADFGIAKRLDAPQVSVTGSVIGTPSYMPPEQAQGRTRDIGPATDVYALGAILYECLTGKPPFLGASTSETLLHVLYRDPIPPRSLAPAVHTDLETICLKCLEKLPAQRYPSAGELAEDLGRFLSGEPVKARPLNALGRVVRWARRRPAQAGLIASVVVAVLALVAGSVALFYNARLQEALATARQEQHRAEASAAEAERQRRLAQRYLYAAQLSVARRAWLEGNLARTLTILGQYTEGEEGKDLRHFEWYHLWRLCHEAEASWPQGQPVREFVASKDGRLVVLTLADGRVVARNPHTGALVATLPGPRQATSAIDLAADGTLVSGSQNGLVLVRELTTGKEVSRYTGHAGRPVFSVACQPGGPLVASAGIEGSIHLWDRRTGKRVHLLQAEEGAINCVRFAPGGEVLAAGTVNGSIQVWSVKDGKLLHTLFGHRDQVTDLAFGPGGRKLVSGSLDRTLWLWEPGVNKGTVLGEHPAPVTSVAFSPDGSAVASGGWDRTLRIWDVARGLALRTFRGHTDWVNAVAWLPAGRRLLSSGRDGELKRWDRREQEDRQLPGHSEAVVTLAFGQSGRWLASRGTEGSVRVVDGQTGTLAGHLPAEAPAAWWLAGFAGRDQLVALHREKGQISLHSVGVGEKGLTPGLGVPLAPLPGLTGAALSPDGTMFLAYGKKGLARLIDRTTGRTLRTLKGHTAEVTAAAFLPDGKQLVTAGEDATVRIWEVATGKCLHCLRGHQVAVIGLAVSRSGERMATGGLDGVVLIWECASGKLQQRLQGHIDAVRGLAFSSDGRRLATAGLDRAIKLWDTATWQEVLSLELPEHGLTQVAFHPDGRALAAGLVNGPIVLYRGR